MCSSAFIFGQQAFAKPFHSFTELSKFDSYFADKVSSKYVVGLEYLVADKAGVIRHKAMGFRDIEDTKPLSKGSLFRIYSLTKPITTTAVLILVDKGMIGLNDPITKYIPEFSNMKILDANGVNDIGKPVIPIRVIDLLRYQSGIGYIPKLYKKAGVFSGSKNIEELVLKIAGLPLLHKPREGYQYGVASEVLAYLVEVVSNTQFNAFVKQEILTPLNMHDTGYMVAVGKKNRLVSRYIYS